MNLWTLHHLNNFWPRRFRARFPRAALVFLGLCAFVFGGIGAPIVRADDAANEAARELARKVAAQLDPKQTLSIQIQDLTGELSTADRAGVVTAFTSEMFSHGFHVISDGLAEPTVRLTLSSSSSSRLWIAEFTRDAKSQVLLISFARDDGPVVPTETGSVRIERQLIFEQTDPILDFAIIKRQGAAPAKILILGPENLATFDQVDGHWRMEKSVPVPHKAPIPRDPRGILFVHKEDDSFFAGIPGTACNGDYRSGLSLKCDTSRNGWSFAIAPASFFLEELVADRNFFRPIAVVVQDPSAKSDQVTSRRPYVFSWGSWGGFSDGIIIEARLDGRIWLQVGKERSIPLSINLGSDLARIGGGCVDHTAIMVTGDSDFTSTDRIQVFQITDHRLVALSPVAELPGPVRALQVFFGVEPARAVVQNLKTGHYEAYEITLACNH